MRQSGLAQIVVEQEPLQVLEQEPLQVLEQTMR
jgi:hypothetical protein